MAIAQREVADSELIARAGQGDQGAFEALYERHFQGLYDFALRMVRDADVAADVVQSTFVKAWEAGQKQKGVVNAKAWLYTVARNLAIDELRVKKRFVDVRADEAQDEEGFPFAIPDLSRLSDPASVVQERELVSLVWESAAALNPEQYALLDLHVRRGLDADELAAHLGVAKGALYTRLSRLRDSLEEAVTTTVLMRRGRRECPQLAVLLDQLGATESTRAVRKAVNEHLKDCRRCQRSKRRFVSPAEIFAGISLVPISLELMEDVWSRIGAELGFSAAAVGGAASAAPAQSGAPAASGASHGSAASSTVAKGVAASALATGAALMIASALVFRGQDAVDDPGDVRSTTHAVGQSSRESVIRMAWSRQEDADAYSVSWAPKQTLPDEVPDLDGDATGATSPPLGPGRWYFNLRTRGHGDWTSTVHVGPFVILGDLHAARDRHAGSTRIRSGQRKHSRPRLASSRLEGRAAPDSPAVTGVAGVVEVKETSPESANAPATGRKSAPRRTPIVGPVARSPQPPPAPPAPPPPSPSPPPPIAPPATPVVSTPTTTTPSPTTTTPARTTTTPDEDEKDEDDERDEERPRGPDSPPKDKPPRDAGPGSR